MESIKHIPLEDNDDGLLSSSSTIHHSFESASIFEVDVTDQPTVTEEELSAWYTYAFAVFPSLTRSSL
jgi:hypothetical protein